LPIGVVLVTENIGAAIGPRIMEVLLLGDLLFAMPPLQFWIEFKRLGSSMMWLEKDSI
jgi:hypothetical protein